MATLLLVVAGPPDADKATLVSYLAQHLRDQGIAAATNLGPETEVPKAHRRLIGLRRASTQVVVMPLDTQVPGEVQAVEAEARRLIELSR